MSCKNKISRITLRCISQTTGIPMNDEKLHEYINLLSKEHLDMYQAIADMEKERKNNMENGKYWQSEVHKMIKNKQTASLAQFMIHASQEIGKNYANSLLRLIKGSIDSVINELKEKHNGEENEFSYNDMDDSAFYIDKNPKYDIFVIKTQNRQFIYFFGKNKDAPYMKQEVHIREIWDSIDVEDKSHYAVEDIDETISQLKNTDDIIEQRKLILEISEQVSKFSDKYNRPSLKDYEIDNFMVDYKNKNNGIKYGDVRDAGFVFSKSHTTEGDVLNTYDVISALDEIDGLNVSLDHENLDE